MVFFFSCGSGIFIIVLLFKGSRGKCNRLFYFDHCAGGGINGLPALIVCNSRYSCMAWRAVVVAVAVCSSPIQHVGRSAASILARRNPLWFVKQGLVLLCIGCCIVF